MRLARRTSLLQARPSFQQQGIVTRASARSEQQEQQQGGESVVVGAAAVDGANAQVPQAAGGDGVVAEVPPFRIPGVAPPAGTPTSSMFV